MKRLAAWLSGALGGIALYRLFLQHREPVAELPPAAGPDPRAEELRARLEEARTIVDEPEELDAAEVPVDEAEAVPPDPEERRRRVHDRARSAVDDMRRSRD